MMRLHFIIDGQHFYTTPSPESEVNEIRSWVEKNNVKITHMEVELENGDTMFLNQDVVRKSIIIYENLDE